jgi:outer membrane receptor for ferrienterochelin and colicins
MGVRTSRAWSVLLFFVFFAAPVAAQSGSIAGRVTSATGDPIANALVRVTNASGREVANTLSGATGQYRVASVPAGTYAVGISAVGFDDASIAAVQVTVGGTATADATLEQKAFELDPVVVSVSKETEKAVEAPQHVEVVTERDIDVRPAVTPVDHLRSTPGVDVITAGLQSTNVVVRGFNNIFSGSLHTLTDHRIAGVPSLRVNLMHFIPQTNDDLERIEVVLGPGSALYGPNTANGVLHLITKSPLTEQSTTASIAGGERSLLHATFRTAQLLGENVGVKLSGQYLRGDEWPFTDPVEVATRQQALEDPAAFRASLPLDVDGTPLTEDQIQARIDRLAARDFDVMRYSLDARADWRVTDDFTAIFSAGRTVSGSGIELTGIGAAQVDDWAYGYYQARARWKRLFAQAYLNTSDAGDTYLLRTGAPIVDQSKVWVAQLQHGFTTWAGRQNFTYGADFIRTAPETERTINGSREEDDTYQEFGAYLQSETALSQKFDLVLAGRIDNHSELEDPVFSPRAALVFKPVEDQTFRATYNRAFSTPSSLNLFLDIDGGPAGALGPLGFRVRAQGPGRTGFAFRDDAGELFGVRSPFAATFNQTPRDIIPISLAGIYNLQVTGLAAAAAAGGQPLPPAMVAAIRGFTADPTFGGLTLSTLDPVTQARTALATAEIPNVPGIEESTSETFEVGYKGILGERLLLAADVWHERKTNFTSPLILQTPLVMMTPEQLVPFLVPRLTAVILAGNPTVPPAQAQAQATAIAMNMAQIPGGVIGSPDMAAQGADLLATYVNFGEVDLTGFDVSATALLTDQWQLGVTGSLVSDDFFRLPLAGQPDQIVALNAPKKKATATLGYRASPTVGLNGEVRVRYTDGFPVNSADFIGTGCIEGGSGDCVDSYTLADLTLGYRVPQQPGLEVQLSVQNIFDTGYRSFVGVPEVGRLALLRLRYTID